MKILVFSDSHNHPDRMDAAIAVNLSYGLSRVFFLGDGIRDCELMEAKYPGLTFSAVLGNCDSFRSLPGGNYEKLIEAGGMRFLLAHGHKLGVKSGIQSAADYAIAKGADVLLFGHTHEAFDETIDGSSRGHVRCINPGAVGDWFHPSFALLEIIGDQLVCGFGK